MSVDLSEPELGLVVTLGALREVHQGLNIHRRRWFAARDPNGAAETGYVILGHGCEACIELFNALHFRVPPVSSGSSERADRTILIIDPSTAIAGGPGYDFLNGPIVEDPVEDFFEVY